jgi:Cu-Zn family superoxide dismutase
MESQLMRINLLAVAIAGLAAGCAGAQGSGPKAVAQLEATKGNTATGTVTFEQRGGKVVVTAEVRGLKPNAEHGFHVHEKGDCSSGDGMSAGGHFNPKGAPHGQPGHGPHHSGDIPALKADANGAAKLVWEGDELTVTDGPLSVVGRGVIVHRDPDDYKTQPTGNAGPRLACGVVKRM